MAARLKNRITSLGYTASLDFSCFATSAAAKGVKRHSRMQIIMSLLITAGSGFIAWKLKSFLARLVFVITSAFIAANVSYFISLLIYPNSEMSSWQGIMINTSFYISAAAGLYIVVLIQFLKKAGASNDVS